jgi:hypothetical protein
MKSTLIEAEVEKSEIKFPCMAVNRNNSSVIVLFTGPTKGTVVSSGCIGKYSEDWGPVTNNGLWTILPPGTKIELVKE